jgi:hypothetical protein
MLPEFPCAALGGRDEVAGEEHPGNECFLPQTEAIGGGASGGEAKKLILLKKLE